MKKKNLVLTSMVALGMGLAMVTSTSHAASIDITDDMPSTGSVVLRGRKVVSASSDSLLKPVKTPKAPSSPFFMSLYNINIKNGRWVCFSDHQNIFNGYKWSHSRFYHSTRYHHATAKVGNGKPVTHYANAGQWAEAVAKGYGLAQAWYGID